MRVKEVILHTGATLLVKDENGDTRTLIEIVNDEGIYQEFIKWWSIEIPLPISQGGGNTLCSNSIMVSNGAENNVVMGNTNAIMGNTYVDMYGGANATVLGIPYPFHGTSGSITVSGASWM